MASKTTRHLIRRLIPGPNRPRGSTGHQSIPWLVLNWHILPIYAVDWVVRRCGAVAQKQTLRANTGECFYWDSNNDKATGKITPYK